MKTHYYVIKGIKKGLRLSRSTNTIEEAIKEKKEMEKRHYELDVKIYYRTCDFFTNETLNEELVG